MAATKKEKIAFGNRFTEAVNSSDLAGKADKEVGKALGGVSGTTIWNWKNGDKLPTMANGIIIAKRLKIALEWLMTGRGDKLHGRANTPEGEALLLVFEGSNKDEQAEWLTYAAGKAWASGDTEKAEELRQMAEQIKKST